MKLELKYLTAYLAHKVECSYKEYKDENKRLKAYFTGISRTDGIETTYKRKRKGCTGDYIGFDGNNNINDLEFKLHLRPLSDLTKENLIEAGFEDWEIELEWIIKQHTNELPYGIVEYLLSKHFDLFDLIENNLAIDINTL